MMKKIILFLAAIMPLAAMAEDLKFGYINTQEVMMLMPEISTIEKQMAELKATHEKHWKEVNRFAKSYTSFSLNGWIAKISVIGFWILYAYFCLTLGGWIIYSMCV